jgi:hypothetical protein
MIPPRAESPASCPPDVSARSSRAGRCRPQGTAGTRELRSRSGRRRSRGARGSTRCTRSTPECRTSRGAGLRPPRSCSPLQRRTVAQAGPRTGPGTTPRWVRTSCGRCANDLQATPSAARLRSGANCERQMGSRLPSPSLQALCTTGGSARRPSSLRVGLATGSVRACAAKGDGRAGREGHGASRLPLGDNLGLSSTANQKSFGASIDFSSAPQNPLSIAAKPLTTCVNPPSPCPHQL